MSIDKCSILDVKIPDLVIQPDPISHIAMHPQLNFMFHGIYGSTDNSEAQVEQFKKYLASVRPTIYIVAGVAGSGKSWICEQVGNHMSYLKYDKTPKIQTLDRIYKLFQSEGKPIVYDRFTHVSTFIKQFSSLFDVKLCVIIEDRDILIQRLRGRGGEPTPSWHQRCRRMQTLAKRAVIYGNTTEILQYLNNVSIEPTS